MFKKFLKYLAGFSPFPLTKNEYYDRLTEQVIKRICSKDSVCVDVGANKGRILSMFIKHCPKAIHYAFEPIPHYYFLLVRKYGSAANLFKLAISDTKGQSTFSYVLDDPAYSSLKQRQFHQPKSIKHYEVETDLLDNIILEDIDIKLIKLDIEGGEYEALLGAEKVIESSRPYILFEFGKGGADAFNVTPKMMYDFFNSRNYQLNLIKAFLNTKPSLTFPAFKAEYETGKEYFFIASPGLAQ